MCWSTNPNPTITNSITTNDGIGVGSFTRSLSGLIPGTVYYVRSYATSSLGTTYGHLLTFFVTAIVDVTNPVTGKTWMDRNLGASRAAESITDTEAYGDFYQWGRGADGHQVRKKEYIFNSKGELLGINWSSSRVTNALSNSDTPGHGNFIAYDYPFNSYGNWRRPSNDNLWQGVNGINNPCPHGYRLPTADEWVAERNSWSADNISGAFLSCPWPVLAVAAAMLEG